MKLSKQVSFSRYQKLLIPVAVWLILFSGFLFIMHLIIQGEVEKQLWQRALTEGFYKARLFRRTTLKYMANQSNGRLRDLNEQLMDEIFDYFAAPEDVVFGQLEDNEGVVWCNCKSDELAEIPTTKVDIFWNDVDTDISKIMREASRVKGTPYYNLILPIVKNGRMVGRISLGFSSSKTVKRIHETTRIIRKKLGLYTALSLLVFTMLTYYIIKLLFRINRLQRHAVEREHFALVGRMANGLAHELKNPLNAMTMSVQMIDEDLTNDVIDKEQFSEMINDIKLEVRRLSGVLEGFLKFARPTPLKLGQTDIAELVNSVSRLLKPQLIKKNVELILIIPDKIPELLLDGEKIKQVFINLILNALEASTSGNKIEVALEYRKKELAVTVTDFGAGITSENLPRIFDTYFTTKKSGSGLGLAITKKIIEEHEGLIKVESIPEVKTVFSIILPAKRSL